MKRWHHARSTGILMAEWMGMSIAVLKRLLEVGFSRFVQSKEITKECNCMSKIKTEKSDKKDGEKNVHS